MKLFIIWAVLPAVATWVGVAIILMIFTPLCLAARCAITAVGAGGMTFWLGGRILRRRI